MKLRKPYRAGRNSFFKGVLFGIIMKIILRKESKLLGINRYFTGKQCKHGHLSERYVSDGHCIECEVSDRVKEYRKEYRKTEEGKKVKQKSNLKYPNAIKSRAYYSRHKRTVVIMDNCEQCKSDHVVEAHHHDYNLPLDVTYLCKPCHEDWHIHNTPLNRETGIFTK